MSSNRPKRSTTAAASAAAVAAASTSTRITRSQSNSTSNNTTITLDTPPRRISGNRVRNVRRPRPVIATRQLIAIAVEAVNVLQPNEAPEVQVVDIATPGASDERLQLTDGQLTGIPRGRPLLQRSQASRPLEVDLTCDHDLDDEPVVLLEDIMAHRRHASNSPPIILGSSPPRNRPRITQTGHSTFQVHSMEVENDQQPQARDDNEVMDLSVNQRAEGLGPVEPQPSTSGAYNTEAANEIQCPICLDGLAQMKRENRQLHSTMCGHLFCKSCIMQVIIQTKQCPKCRQPLSPKKIHPIFI